MSNDKYKVTNWKAYNEGLKKRGSLRLWIQDDIAQNWKYTGIKKRGGQQQYSDMAIELCLVIRKIYHLPLRQTEGFMNSFFEQNKSNIKAPHYTTLSKRSGSLAVDLSANNTRGTITNIVVDSTGLKVYGEGEMEGTQTWSRQASNLDEDAPCGR